jgi:hypothetical protein
MIRSFVSLVSVLAALLTAAAAAGAAPASAPAPRVWQAFPALITLVIENTDADGGATVHARTAPDSAGQGTVVTFDPRTGSWSRPVTEPAGEPAPRLDQVLVFAGGLFDQLAGKTSVELGSGFTLALRDSGYALLENGEDRGWPVVTEDDVERWGRELRLGLPREFPEDRLMQLLSTGRLRNVPGPAVVTADALWFGLAGGFSGGDGQLGGVVVYDRKDRTFHVLRHKFMVDASVTRLLVSGDDVWIGTGRFGPTSLEGLRGLVLHRPKKREWRQFVPDNSRIAGDLVYDLATDGRMVWATTNLGVSRYDSTKRLWSSWFWHRSKTGPGYELTDTLPGAFGEEIIRE